jgi:4'-phosphopantetheinyl transferase
MSALGNIGHSRWAGAVDAHLIDLVPGEIHLWLSDYAQITDPRLLETYRLLMAPEEREQESNFYFDRDRRRYLVTRALVRTVLSRYEARLPHEWTFQNTYYGRPVIANASTSCRPLCFNVSHTDSLIVLAVTCRKALGIDIENMSVRRISDELANHYLAPVEIAALHSVDRALQQERLWEYWTLKESYLKARGTGMSLPLDKFSFRYPHDSGIEVNIEPELNDQAAQWQFWQFRPAPQYLLAVCAESTVVSGPVFRIRASVPLRSEEFVTLPPLRRSECPPWEPKNDRLPVSERSTGMYQHD